MQYDSLDKNKITHFYCELSLWEERQEGGGLIRLCPGID